MRAILCLFAVSCLSAQEHAPEVDKLFGKFSGKSPGCAVGIAQNGKSIFARGYGIADLEHDVPLSPESPFYMASVSKQFTAMSVLLLAEEGRIQTSDSIRKYIPELPSYADEITLYHLLTHTSGVRDYLTLGSLAGQPPDYVFTDRGTLRLISRQSALNFAPGAEFLYSNSGYVLLSLMVKNVTQKNLNQFAHDRIFAPLEMKSTRFQHDHSALVPGKAFGYEQRDGLWHVSNSMLNVVGDGGLYSSVDDMLHWVENFDAPKIGAKALAIMQTPGKLSTGKEINYGMGLEPAQYRGLRIVEHGGALAGYRTEVLWFPAQRFSVVCLCNNGTANAGQLARQVAAIYLSPEMTAPAAVKGREVSGIVLAPNEVHARAGLFRSEERGYLEIVERDSKLYLPGAPSELIALDKHRFTANFVPEGWELEFADQNPPGSLELRPPGQSPARFQRVVPVTLSENDRKADTGDFESRELGVTYRIAADAVGLSVQIGDRPEIRLQSAGADRMRTEAGGLELVFRRNAGEVRGFELNAGRVRKIEFHRI